MAATVPFTFDVSCLEPPHKACLAIDGMMVCSAGVLRTATYGALASQAAVVYAVIKQLLLLTFMAVASEAMAQDAPCVRERAAMVETIRDYAKAYRSASWRQWGKRNAIGLSPSVLVGRIHGCAGSHWPRPDNIATIHSRYDNVSVKVGDGYLGWPECGPFDAMIVTAALDHVPPPLIEQLKVGGRLVMPLGPAHAPQQLTVLEKIAPSETRTRSISLVAPLCPLRVPRIEFRPGSFALKGCGLSKRKSDNSARPANL